MKKFYVAIMMVAIMGFMPVEAFAISLPDIPGAVKEKVEQIFPERLHEEFESEDGKYMFTVDETDDGLYQVVMESKSNWEVLNREGEKLSDAKKVKFVWTQKEWNNRIRKEFEEFTFQMV